jgi:1-aminocyclopropane-1-carboxylate synthase
MHDMLAWGIANPGDGFLTSRPVYGRLELDFGNKSQVRVVYADTSTEDSFEPEVALSYERALMRSNTMGVRVKAVFIVNPHNPLGWPPFHILSGNLLTYGSQAGAIREVHS